MGKKVYIYAYTEMNLGDDLFIKILCERYPNERFYVMAKPKNSSAFRQIKNLTTIPKIPWIDGVLAKLKIHMGINNQLQKIISIFCDVIVCIGGSLFIQNKNWENKINQFQNSILNNKPFFVLGSNFGPYTNENFFHRFNTIFSDITDICFREENSYQLFSNLTNVRKESDIVFTYKMNHKIIEKDNIVISVINLKERYSIAKYENMYIEKIIDIVNFFLENNFSVTLMGFCSAEGDTEVINSILENKILAGRAGLYKYIYNGDIDKALNVLQESKYIVGSRFHAMILGWLFNKIVYPIVYSEKSLNVMNDIGFKGPYANIKYIDQLDIETDYKKLMESSKISIEKEIESANRQFVKLDELLLS